MLTVAICVLVILSVFGFFIVKELRATAKTNKIEIGDKFSVKVVSANPYDNDVLFCGTVINKSGNYIQYIDENGDTSSTNIRDYYLFPRMTEVVVYKH